MSKIAEQKVNQWILKHKDGDVLYVQDAYIAAYDQAMQDFLEKAEKVLTERMYFSDDEAKEFKNYMKNEM